MAIAGLSLGVAALVIVLSVMNGFEKELQTRVLGVVPQLIIRSNENIDIYRLEPTQFPYLLIKVVKHVNLIC